MQFKTILKKSLTKQDRRSLHMSRLPHCKISQPVARSALLSSSGRLWIAIKMLPSAWTAVKLMFKTALQGNFRRKRQVENAIEDSAKRSV
jgi:hypothetical protein